MSNRQDREALRQQFLEKADATFAAAMVRAEQEEMDLSQIEEMVEQLRFELTAELVESVIQWQAAARLGPGPSCAKCGREMRYKGKKWREVVTSQGEVELNRAYYYCEQCEAGFFPPG
jgi:uncharacterized protein with PIN domain